jgi:hypothetical protein
MGLLLGLDLSGTAEVADCFALPTGLGTSGVSALLDGDKSESKFAVCLTKSCRLG